MIQIKNLRKEFGPIVAVDGVSFDTPKGEVLGFLGPNGAGKSTTMKMVTGFLPPTAGTAVVCGHDVLKDPIAVKASLGYLPEGAPLYGDMTPEGLYKFIAQVRGIPRPRRASAIDRVKSLVKLEGVMRQPIETLSKGYKRRVGLGQAILHDPPVLLLDEPTDGLDPNQKHDVRRLINEMAQEKAIILSTHILEEVDAVCTRAIVIARGRIVADGTPAELQARSVRHNAVRLRVRASADAVESELKQIATVAGVEREASANGVARCLVLAKPGAVIAGDVAGRVRAKGWAVEELVVEPGRLDDVFRDLTMSPSAGSRS
ncbi:MAG: ABC transporter ATP-binding protein [Planctomycetota bacterium]|nr:MAG: ABC transporter ATP-binding protein [Planctomycetota bacterium]